MTEKNGNSRVVWWLMGLVGAVMVAAFLSSLAQHQILADKIESLREGRVQNAADIASIKLRLDVDERMLTGITERLNHLEQQMAAWNGRK